MIEDSIKACCFLNDLISVFIRADRCNFRLWLWSWLHFWFLLRSWLYLWFLLRSRLNLWFFLRIWLYLWFFLRSWLNLRLLRFLLFWLWFRFTSSNCKGWFLIDSCNNNSEYKG